MINISNKTNCSGCHACFNVCPKECIEMKSDNEGFWYPEIDKDKCIDCRLCEKVCPIINSKESNNNPKAYACYNKDETIRMDSSSGGLFTLLASKTINKGGAVYGAMFNVNFEVIHSRVTNLNDLSKLRGSKYTQSKIEKIYKLVYNDLNNGIEVFFSGTPCQIDGLLLFLRKDYDNLICQDIICHGVPSPMVWKDYLNSFNSNIEKVRFRNKDNGWTKFNLEIVTSKTRYVKNKDNDIYMKAFLSNLSLRPSCYECHSKSLHRNSDITLADFWGVNNIDPSLNDDKGISLVFVNSKKGHKLFKNISNDIVSKEVDINEVIKYNSAAYQSIPLNEKRKIFFDIYDGNNLKEVVSKLTKDSLIKRVKIQFYGLKKRIRRAVINK